jgi:enoyl-CoA hydratase/carnithine racemase
MFGVGARYVQEAKKLKAESPDLADKVRAGEVKLWEATQEAKRRVREAAREEAIATAYAEVREDFGVIHGDFRECDLADESVDMVFLSHTQDITRYLIFSI